MELGNLAFTDDEVVKALKRCAELVIPGEIDSNAALGLVLNRILGEKLEKTPKMFCRHDTWSDGTHSLWTADECPHFSRATHTARLVLIEEMK